MEYIGIAHNCRACQIKTEEESEKIFIFTTVKLPDIFKETTSLDIHENDGLPKVLCCSCYDRLVEAYNFRKMCAAAVMNFQKMLSIYIREKKYVPPESLSDVHLTNGTPISVNAETDVLDSPNTPRSLNCSPERVDSPTDISDILSIDENIPEIIKTDPDDVTEEETVSSERQDDTSMAREAETSNAFPENSHIPEDDERPIKVLRTPRRRKSRTDSDDDVPLASRKLRSLRSNAAMEKKGILSEKHDKVSMAKEAQTPNASPENDYNSEKDDRPIKVSRTIREISKPRRRKIQKDSDDDVPLTSRKLRNKATIKEGVPSEGQDDASLAREAGSSNASPEKEQRTPKVSRKRIHKLQKDSSDDNVPLTFRKLRNASVIEKKTDSSERQDNASIAKVPQTSNTFPENNQPPEKDDHPIKVLRKRRRKLQKDPDDNIPLSSRKLRKNVVEEKGVPSEKLGNASKEPEIPNTSPENNHPPEKDDNSTKVLRKPRRKLQKNSDDNVPLNSRMLRNANVMQEKTVSSERQDDASMSREAETSNASPEKNYLPEKDDRSIKVLQKRKRKLQKDPDDNVPQNSRKLRKNVVEEKGVPSERLDNASKEPEIPNSSPENNHPPEKDDRPVKKGVQLVKKIRNTSNRQPDHLKPSSPKANTKFKCSMCKASYSNFPKLRIHIRTQHLGLKSYKCEVCKKEFTSFHNLNIHLNVHESTKGSVKQNDSTQCDICGVEKETTDQLIDHIKTHKQNDKWYCTLCPYTAVKKYILVRHVKVTHKGVREYNCPRCNKSFTGVANLEGHILRHDGIKNYVCPICGAKKISSSALKNHMPTHFTEKVACKYCSLIFTRVDNLKQHVKIVHQKIKKYQCYVCNKSFGVSSTLKDHLMTHTGEKPHVCNECGMSFIRQSRLKRHMRRRHNSEKPKPQNKSNKLKAQDNSKTPEIQENSKKPKAQVQNKVKI